ncbi:lasso peptide biosynthesis PqqD family chaperone, partial [Pseudonocardia sp. EV170527-09]|uniref:lasso peptide biosynthesis PqqD family chaperone n=1 Tax=Pseudonocardia sp. EV170527-09 TaxID=2603411 RepID=UPI0011F3F9D1
RSTRHVPPPEHDQRPGLKRFAGHALDERAGRYWQLNQTGTTVLAELERGRTVREIVDGLVAEHDVELARATADVRQLVAELSKARLTEGDAV